MSDQTKRPLTPEQKAIWKSIPKLPTPIMSIDDRMALGAVIIALDALYEGRFSGTPLNEGSTAKTLLKQALDELHRITTPPF